MEPLINLFESPELEMTQWAAMALYYLVKRSVEEGRLGEIKGMFKIAKLLEKEDVTTLKFITGIVHGAAYYNSLSGMIEAISTLSLNKLAFYSTGGVEALALLMSHSEFTIQHNVCGALVNLAAEGKARQFQ